MINGKRYSWESITINLPHGVLIDVESIDYEDARSTRRVYGRGSRARGFSQGNYEASGTLTLRREEYQRLAQRAGAPGIYGMRPFDITVSYADENMPTITDTLQSVKFTSRSTGGSQDDEAINVELAFEVLDDIQFGGQASFQERR